MHRFIFDALPRTGSNSVIQAAASSGLTWQRAYRETDTLEAFKIACAELDIWVSHYLFRDYEPEPGERLITWVRDPVDMFASGFRYWQIADVRGDEFPPEMAEFMRQVRKFEDMRAYVDHVLEHRPAGVFPRGLFDRDWDRYDFIGFTATMAGSLDRFNLKYGTDLPYRHVNASGQQWLRYRRNELDEFFADELEAYAQAKCLI